MRPCECGCGQPVGVVQKTDKRAGIKKGDPRRFVFGHASKTRQAPYVPSHLRGADSYTLDQAVAAVKLATFYEPTVEQPTPRHKRSLSERMADADVRLFYAELKDYRLRHPEGPKLPPEQKRQRMGGPLDIPLGRHHPDYDPWEDVA